VRRQSVVEYFDKLKTHLFGQRLTKIIRRRCAVFPDFGAHHYIEMSRLSYCTLIACLRVSCPPNQSSPSLLVLLSLIVLQLKKSAENDHVVCPLHADLFLIFMYISELEAFFVTPLRCHELVEVGPGLLKENL